MGKYMYLKLNKGQYRSIRLNREKMVHWGQIRVDKPKLIYNDYLISLSVDV